MGLKITSFYCLCDDFLISEGWRDDLRSTMSTAEVMTAALTAAAFFPAALKKAANFLSSTDMFLQCCQKVSSSAACAAFLNQSGAG